MWARLDSLFAFCLAIVVSVLAVADRVESGTAVNATLAVLAVIAFSLLRGHSAREASGSKIDELVRLTHTMVDGQAADDFFHSLTSELSILRTARAEVALVQESGTLITENARHQLVSLVRRGGRLRVVVAVTDPRSASLLALRNANLQPLDLLLRRDSFRGHLHNLVEQAGDAAKRVEVRWIPYPVDTTFALADPTDTDAEYRRGLVRLAGFSKAFPEKLDFTFDGEASPRVMAHFAREFEDYFLAAHKVLLLEGAPRVGKTTLLTHLVDSVPSGAPIFAVLSPATFADPLGSGERTGFALRTTDSADDIPFARRRGAQDYESEGTAWLDVLPRLRDARLSGKILVIDEIGHLQSQVPGFVAEIQAILDDPAATLFASIGIDGSASIDAFKAHPRTSLITLTEASRASVEELIRKEFLASLRTAAILAAGQESRG